MTVKLKVSYKNELKRVRKEQDKIIKNEVFKTSLLMKRELEVATPVDTGRASRSWSIIPLGKSTLITNSVPYIENLNNGTSKQAPKFFIERIALKYGRAFGLIVQKLF